MASGDHLSLLDRCGISGPGRGSSSAFAALRYLGRNSIVVYLAFFLGMAASRAVLMKTGLELGTVALLVTASGIFGALAWFRAVRHTPLRFQIGRAHV